MDKAQSKFKENEIVLYQNGDTFQLGLISEVVPVLDRAYLKQQGFPPKGEPQGEEFTSYKYRVWYHTGDTTAMTSEDKLHKVNNAYAFLILRRKADTSSINDTPARELAAEIIDGLPNLTELEGEPYYECEDALTEFINKYKP
jgi:hypothetical protein